MPKKLTIQHAQELAHKKGGKCLSSTYTNTNARRNDILTKEVLEIECKTARSYHQIGQKYSISPITVKRHAKKLGLELLNPSILSVKTKTRKSKGSI